MDKLNARNQYHRDTLIEQRVNTPFSFDIIHKEIISYANSLQAGKVRLLDAGAGEGRYREILKDINNLEYIGVDSGVASDEWDFSKVISCDMNNMEFLEDNSIDIVIMIQVLSHIPDLEKSISELSRIMKKDAKIFITTQNMQSLTHVPYDFRRLTAYGIEKVFKDNNIVLEKISPLLYGDNVSAAKQLEYALSNNINYCSKCGFLIKFFSKAIIKFLHILNKLLKKIDLKREMPLNPIGYYAVLRKGKDDK